MMKVLLVDNFDSFVFNLYDYIQQLGHKCSVIRNDSEALKDIVPYSDVIVLSPGPGKPANSGYLMDVVREGYAKKPILGICLGHQALGQHAGMRLVKAAVPVHGIPCVLKTSSHDLFEGIGESFQAMRYHSLVLEKGDCEEYDILAKTEEGEIMMINHKNLPITGMQYHPESILTPMGLKLLGNWFRLITKGFHLCAIFFYITH